MSAVDPVAAAPGAATIRFAATFGSATAVGLVAQLAWLGLGSRAMSPSDFGVVLAAQALYGVLLYGVDNGTALYGARLVATMRLDPVVRGAIVRLRIGLAGVAIVVGAGVASLGGEAFLVASAPFALALLLVAALGHWERFGRGEGDSWSSYLVLRGAAPAVAAAGFLALDRGLPLAAAGVAECLAILAVAVTFRLRPEVRRVSQARVTSRLARETAAVALPSLLWVVGFGWGPVALAAVGLPGAAAALAVGFRLLTGVNQLAGVVSTSLFPSLARKEAGRDLGRIVRPATGAMIAIAAAATIAVLAAPASVGNVLLGRTSDEIEGAALLGVGGAAAVGLVLLGSTILVARDRDLAVLRANLVGTLLVAVATPIAVVGPRPAAVFAATFVLAQITAAALLASEIRRIDLGAARAFGGGVCAALLLVGASAAAVLDARAPAFLLASAVLAWAGRRAVVR